MIFDLDFQYGAGLLKVWTICRKYMRYNILYDIECWIESFLKETCNNYYPLKFENLCSMIIFISILDSWHIPCYSKTLLVERLSHTSTKHALKHQPSLVRLWQVRYVGKWYPPRDPTKLLHPSKLVIRRHLIDNHWVGLTKMLSQRPTLCL